jgi:hypothetical protein
MRVNGRGAVGCTGPIEAPLAWGGEFRLDWFGPVGMPHARFHSFNLRPASLVLGACGRVDLGAPPNYADVSQFFDGLSWPLFNLGSQGRSHLSFAAPLPPGTDLGSFQSVVFQASGGSCAFALTASFHVAVY